MKNKFFKSLILGVCCSVLFSVGSFASSQITNDAPIPITNMESSLVDLLLNLKTESSDGYYDKFCVIIRLGNDFAENTGYYKLDLVKTFGHTLYGRQIKELTCPNYTGISEKGGAVIHFGKTNSGGRCAFFEPFELFLMGITPDNVSYNPEIGYLASIDKVHDYILYFKKLDECASGGVKLYQPASITHTILEKNISNHTIEVFAKLGEEFGDNTGYYVLDVTNSFDKSDNVYGKKTFGCSQVKLENNQFEVKYNGSSEIFNLDLTPSCVSKETKNGKEYLVFEDNGKKLYFEKAEAYDVTIVFYDT